MVNSCIIYLELAREYPDLMEKIKSIKNNKIETILNLVQIFLSCFIPIVNVFILLSVFLKEKEIKANCIKKFRERVNSEFREERQDEVN